MQYDGTGRLRHSPRQVGKLPNRPAERGRRRPRSTTCACPGDLQHPRDNGSRYFACRILCSKLSLANQQALLVFALPTSMLKLPWNLGNVRPGRTSRRRFFSAGALEPWGASSGRLYRATHLDTPSVCSIVTHGQILAPRSGPSLNATCPGCVLRLPQRCTIPEFICTEHKASPLAAHFVQEEFG